eukprot:6442321-Amphidinium_carterae.3
MEKTIHAKYYIGVKNLQSNVRVSLVFSSRKIRRTKLYQRTKAQNDNITSLVMMKVQCGYVQIRIERRGIVVVVARLRALGLDTARPLHELCLAIT